MGGAKNPLLVAILAALSGCTDSFEGQGCMIVPADTAACPARKDVNPKSLSHDRVSCEDAEEIVEINGEGALTEQTRQLVPSQQSVTETACCYPVTIVRHDVNGECKTAGRPFLERGEPRLAALLERSSAPSDTSRRARAWALAGAAEHGSVAAFARLALELMALGAPTSLLTAVQRAGLDEVRHAETCWELARHFGLHVEVGPFPLSSTLELNRSYHALAVATAREGCLSETLGAHLLAAAAAEAPEPDVKSALARMALEEAEHAALAYRIVAWACSRADANTRTAVRTVFDTAPLELELNELALRANIDVCKLQRALQEGIVDVVRPATAALFAS